MKNWGIGVNYCWNYGPSKLLLHFIEYRPDQLNKKLTKIVVNSTMHYCEGSSQKKCLLKVWSFGLTTTKCKMFAKLNRNHLLMTNIFKLHEYHIFGLMKMQFVKKFGLRLTGRRKCYFLIFTFFLQSSNDYCQKSYNGFRGLLGSSTTS